jgi:hypothetical protein
MRIHPMPLYLRRFSGILTYYHLIPVYCSTL